MGWVELWIYNPSLCTDLQLVCHQRHSGGWNTFDNERFSITKPQATYTKLKRTVFSKDLEAFLGDPFLFSFWTLAKITQGGIVIWPKLLASAIGQVASGLHARTHALRHTVWRAGQSNQLQHSIYVKVMLASRWQNQRYIVHTLVNADITFRSNLIETRL